MEPRLSNREGDRALTANAFASDIGKAHSAGMNDHVAKPIEVDRLMEALKRWIK